MKDTIGIIGAGVVGSVLIHYLGQAGHDVYAVEVNKDMADALNSGELYVGGKRADKGQVVHAFNSIEGLYEVKIDHLFICVKTYTLPNIIDRLKFFDDHGTSVISFQNGLDNMKFLNRVVSIENLYRVAVNYAGNMVKPGHVVITFNHPPNYIGTLPEAPLQSVGRAKKIAGILNSAGIETFYTPEIQRFTWQKTILNASIMLTAVLTRLTMGQIMSQPGTRDIVERHMKECIRVAASEGFEFDDTFREVALSYLTNAGPHKTSMSMDFEAGKPLEIDFLNGRIQEYAEKNNIPCPINRSLIALVKGLVLHRDQQVEEP